MSLDITRLVAFFIKPYGIIIMTVIMSFCVWALPIDIPKGFDHPQPLFSVGGFIVSVWYGSIILVSWLSFKLGKRITFGSYYLDRYANLSDNAAYLLITAIACWGVYYVTHFFLRVMGWEGMVDAVQEHQGNVFKQVIQEHKEFKGAASLRYCAILSGGIALYRIMSRSNFFSPALLIDLFNIALLIATSFYSGRLGFVAALIFGICLYAFNHEKITIGLFTTGVTLLVVFSLLSFLTASRTLTYYAARGYTTEYGATTAEVFRYLASPFQVSLGVGNNYSEALRGASYVQIADVDQSLTTDSALNQLTVETGLGAWPIVWLTVGFASFFMGILTHYTRNLLILLYVIFLYCLGELWRIYMFDQGIVITMFAAAIFLVASITMFNVIAGRGLELEEEDDDDDGEGHDENDALSEDQESRDEADVS